MTEPPPRRIRYREIADDLRARIEEGDLRGRRLLPSESELSTRYEASRVTVRKALDGLRAEGLVDSRQGFGWFVATEPIRQHLGRLGTIEEQLEADGRASERRILDFAFVAAPARVAEVLGVDQVLRVDRVNLADGEPFARVTVWCPEELGASLSRAQVAEHTFLELLPVPLGGAVQTIEAQAASAADAALLEIPVGSPVLVCERITSDVGGHPVLVAEHVFPGHRSAFTVDLPHPARASMAPSGLRLVDGAGRR
ncbi:GntR family transcriptional regulator [Iamia sp. SCSIO 61187]|uniref:GntR family transcriptional regulator n=1 Tax=Iamia sp. SCSIO 61187 TaxID=2722752 RepID=UPI001C6298AF|nr:GntR family transcriptional regulator [Iamia sp. SCSIO 61187]QYG93606.1 GntR family transcriptional regulator [Iamia sp. SCSIO 61187]